MGVLFLFSLLFSLPSPVALGQAELPQGSVGWVPPTTQQPRLWYFVSRTQAEREQKGTEAEPRKQEDIVGLLFLPDGGPSSGTSTPLSRAPWGGKDQVSTLAQFFPRAWARALGIGYPLSPPSS